ncbi:MAG: response regulator, partial [Proteobacteria bacterium]|nr:response regulator [Pseudomonadota bacterium]
VISGFIFFKIRYLLAGVTGFLLVAIYGVSLSFFSNVPADFIASNTFFLLFTVIIGMTAGYTIEFHSRMVFLKSSILNQIVKETKKNENLRNKELIRINKSLELEILAHTEAESQLKESEEKYRNLVISLPEGIFIVQDKKIVFLNPSMEKLTGYDAEQLLGSGADILFMKNRQMEDAAENGAKDVFVRKDGQTIFIEKSFVEIIYNSKPALLFTVRDITEKVMATLDKKKLQKELEKARKMEAFGILAGGVAHDLNNVLSGLVSAPDLLLMDLPKGSDLAVHVEAIKDAGRRASGIADELLTMVRGSSRALEPVQFNYVVEDYLMSPEFDRLIKQHPDVEITKEFDSNLPFINASGIHIRKIVMNLVSNAVEAVGKDKGNVIVNTCQVEFHNQRIKGYEKIKNGKFIKFSVMNTGQGISKEDIEHIFEPFYSKKVLGRSGTGLGLTIVWNAVHDHNGYIHVSSQNNQTHFTLYFPISEKTNKPDQLSRIYTLADYSGNNEKILIIDDLESQQIICANMLKRLGYQVTVVSSGEEALFYAKENKIDLVVLDMIMDPGLNGLETYEQLLLIDPQIKAIITSGYSNTDDVKKAQALGAGDYIKKPYSIQTIGLAIKKELSDRTDK